MSSPCLSGGGCAYGFDLDLMKSLSPSARSSGTSSPSSTLSESSNITISNIKKPRAPRKRPNQTYHEAAALLSTTYPKVFSYKPLHHLRKHPPLLLPFEPFAESSDLLPPFPSLTGAAFLLRESSPEKPLPPPCSPFIPKPHESPPSPPPPPLTIDDDFDTKSMLDEEVGEGIDSIFGNIESPSNGSDASNASFNPYIGSLMAFGLSFAANLRRALRRRDDGDWWRSPRVAVRDIVPKFKSLSARPPPPPPEKSKKKKKKKVEVEQEEQVREMENGANNSSNCSNGGEKLKMGGLKLKLKYEEVINEWSDRGSPFGGAAGWPQFPADVHTRLAQIELFPETGNGGMREASVQRYKEKRRSRLFSKKIRYQVRKVNAERRPRMKASGRFAKRPDPLHEAIEEESP